MPSVFSGAPRFSGGSPQQPQMNRNATNVENGFPPYFPSGGGGFSDSSAFSSPRPPPHWHRKNKRGMEVIYNLIANLPDHKRKQYFPNEPRLPGAKKEEQEEVEGEGEKEEEEEAVVAASPEVPVGPSSWFEDFAYQSPLPLNMETYDGIFGEEQGQIAILTKNKRNEVYAMLASQEQPVRVATYTGGVPRVHQLVVFDKQTGDANDIRFAYGQVEGLLVRANRRTPLVVNRVWECMRLCAAVDRFNDTSKHCISGKDMCRLLSQGPPTQGTAGYEALFEIITNRGPETVPYLSYKDNTLPLGPCSENWSEEERAAIVHLLSDRAFVLLNTVPAAGKSTIIATVAGILNRAPARTKRVLIIAPTDESLNHIVTLLQRDPCNRVTQLVAPADKLLSTSEPFGIVRKLLDAPDRPVQLLDKVSICTGVPVSEWGTVPHLPRVSDSLREQMEAAVLGIYKHDTLVTTTQYLLKAIVSGSKREVLASVDTVLVDDSHAMTSLEVAAVCKHLQHARIRLLGCPSFDFVGLHAEAPETAWDLFQYTLTMSVNARLAARHPHRLTVNYRARTCVTRHLKIGGDSKKEEEGSTRHKQLEAALLREYLLQEPAYEGTTVLVSVNDDQTALLRQEIGGVVDEVVNGSDGRMIVADRVIVSCSMGKVDWRVFKYALSRARRDVLIVVPKDQYVKFAEYLDTPFETLSYPSLS